jgi:transcriptional regulator with XRE-family HTH domain
LARRRKPVAGEDGEKLVRPDGLAVRRRRHDRGWSSRELTGAIEEARFNSSGLRETLTPNQIEAIEERAERISYDQLLLLADGLDCDPIDLLAEGELSGGSSPPVRIRPPTRRLN